MSRERVGDENKRSAHARHSALKKRTREFVDAIVRYEKSASDSRLLYMVRAANKYAIEIIKSGGGGRRMCFGEVAIAMCVRGRTRRLNGAQAHCSTHHLQRYKRAHSASDCCYGRYNR
jgi:hypothetical protein